MIEVEIPDVGIVEFPDSMGPDDIKSVLQRKFPRQPKGEPMAETFSRWGREQSLLPPPTVPGTGVPQSIANLPSNRLDLSLVRPEPPGAPTSTLKQLPSALLGLGTDRDPEMAERLEAGRQSVLQSGRTPEQQMQLVNDISRIYDARIGALGAQSDSSNPENARRAKETIAALRQQKQIELANLGVMTVAMDEPVQLPKMTKQEVTGLTGLEGRKASALASVQRAIAGAAEGFATPEGAGMLAAPKALAAGTHAIAKGFIASMTKDAVEQASAAAGYYTAGDTEAGDEALANAGAVASMLGLPLAKQQRGRTAAETLARKLKESPIDPSALDARTIESLRRTVEQSGEKTQFEDISKAISRTLEQVQKERSTDAVQVGKAETLPVGERAAVGAQVEPQVRQPAAAGAEEATPGIPKEVAVPIRSAPVTDAAGRLEQLKSFTDPTPTEIAERDALQAKSDAVRESPEVAEFKRKLAEQQGKAPESVKPATQPAEAKAKGMSPERQVEVLNRDISQLESIAKNPDRTIAERERAQTAADQLKSRRTTAAPEPAKPAPKPETPTDLGSKFLAKHGVKLDETISVTLPSGNTYRAHVTGHTIENGVDKITMRFPDDSRLKSARGQERAYDPLKVTITPLKSTISNRERQATLTGLAPEQRASVNERVRDFDKAIAYDPEFWPAIDPSSAKDARQRGQLENRAQKLAREKAFKVLEIEGDHRNPVVVAEALPKLMRYLAWREAPKPVLELEKPETVEEQKARLADEEVERHKAAERERLAEAAAKPLVGSVGDIGQGDLLGGGDLFSAPPKREAPKREVKLLDQPRSFFTLDNLRELPEITLRQLAKSLAITKWENLPASLLRGKIAAKALERLSELEAAPVIPQGPGGRTRTESAKPEAPESYEGAGLKHAIDELERVSYGFKDRPKQDRQAMAAAWVKAGEILEQRPRSGIELAQALIDNPKRGLTGDESALILRHKVQLENSLNNAAEKTFSGDPETKTEARIEVERLSGELDKFLDAVAIRGSEWGREGRWRQALAYEDFSFATRERILRAKKGGEPLTEVERGTLLKQIAEDQETLKKYEDYILKLETKHREKGAEDILTGVQKEVERELPYGRKVLEAAEDFLRDMEKKFNVSTLEQEIRFELAALETQIPQGPGARTKPSEPTPLTLIQKLARVGAIKMGRGREDFGKWKQAMLDSFGPKVEPLLDQVHDLATKIYHDELAVFGRRHGTKKAEVVRKATQEPTPQERQIELVEKIKERIEDDRADEIASLAQELAKIAVAKGARGWRAVADAVHKELRALIPDQDFHTTLDMISGHGKFKPLSTAELDVAYRQAKQEMNEVRKIQEVIAGEPVKKSGPPFQEPSDVKRRLIAIFNEAKKKFGVIVTDPARQLKSALAARRKYYDNRIKDLEHEIKTRQKIVRERRTPPTSPELEARIVEYRRLKAERDEIFKADLTDEQRLKLALKAMERGEAEYRRRREAGEFATKETAKPWQETPEFKAAKARRDAEKAAFEEMRELDADYQRGRELALVERERTALEKVVAIKEKRAVALAAGDVSKPSKPQVRPLSPEREQLRQEVERHRAELKEINQQIAELRNPKKTSEERALSAYVSRLTTRVAELEQRRAYLMERLASGEITKADLERKVRAPLDISKDSGAMALKARSVAIRNDILKAEHEAELRLMTGREKVWRGIKQTRGALVNLKSSFDFSAPRQALAAILANVTRVVTHPLRGLGMLLRPFGKSFASWWSEQHALTIEQSIKNRPNALSGADKIAGIEYTDLNTQKFTRHEENAHSLFDQWSQIPWRTGNLAKDAAAAPVKGLSRAIRMSNRAFIAFLNSTRAELFDELLRVNFKDRAPTELELKAIGNLVNIATGRGKLNPVTAQKAAEFIWAPKLLASRIQLLTGQPLYHGTAKTRGIVAREYVRMIIGAVLLSQVARMFDEDEEASMVSSDFGKINRGETRVDLWGGFQQPIVLGARALSATSESLKGKTFDIGADRRYGTPGMFMVGANFLRSKLRPDVGAVIDIFDRRNYVGQPTTPLSTAESLLVPLPLVDVAEIMRAHGFGEGLILEALGQFGAGVSHYEDREAQK